jgi:hypothetical protein
LESRLKLLRLGSQYISVLSCSLMLSYDILALPTWDGSEKKSCRNTTGNTHTNKNRHKQDRWVRHTHTHTHTGGVNPPVRTTYASLPPQSMRKGLAE